MRSTKWLHVNAILGALLLASCGGRNSGTPNSDADGGDTDTGTCSDGSECRSGICQGGLCVEAETCVTHGDCVAGQYCHFPSEPNPWTAEPPTPDANGTCSGPCTNDASCGVVGQSCVRGRCYTNIDCLPANNSKDCPPGEVCNQQSRTCTVPPSQCYFNEQCPFEWQCNADHTCIDPDQLAHCTTAANCDNTPGCAVGACECFDGACRVAGACNPANEYKTPVCGTGKYCAGSRCQTATACSTTAADGGQSTCTPFGLVCKAGYCVNPPPCDGNAPNYSCAAYGATWNCHTNTTPPTCSPGAECVRNDQCPAGSYCVSGLNKCEPGCRDNTDCQSTCPSGSALMCAANGCTTAANCDYCGGDHKCSNTATQPDTCDTNDDCTGGTSCAQNSPTDAMACFIDPASAGDCSKSCRMSCDLLVSQLFDPCPAGQKCGGSDPFNTTLMSAMAALMGGGTTTTSSVCYPTTP